MSKKIKISQSEIRIVYLCLLIVLLSTPAFASHNRFDPYVDIDSITWFDRGLYENAIKYLSCVDLNEFYAYADSDKYDGFDRKDVLKYANRLSYSDYNQLADENRYDKYDADDFRKTKDFRCSTQGEFSQYARKNRYDGVEEKDYYSLRGYDDYENQMHHYRHNKYGSGIRYRNNLLVDRFWREDGFGGIASWFR